MEFIEALIFLIKLLISFDTDYLFNNIISQKGGSVPNTGPSKKTDNKSPPRTKEQQQEKKDERKQKRFNEKSQSSGSTKTESSNINNKIEDLENSEEAEGYFGQNFIGELIEMIKTSAIDAYNTLKLHITNYIVVPILFAVVSPAIPFFAVMSVMAAVMKYMLFHFRKL